MIKIPQNNLPIYLQNYTVTILSGDETSGSVDYSTVGIIPSNVQKKRVWNIRLSGTLEPQKDEYIFLFNFENVDYDSIVTFENKISGSFNICDRILDISKNGYFLYSTQFKTLSIIISKKRWGFVLKRNSKFSMNVEINDNSIVQKTYYFGFCQKKNNILSSPNNVFPDLNFTLNCVTKNSCSFIKPKPSETPCPSQTLAPCPTKNPSSSCPTSIPPNSCFQTFTNGITFNYFDEFKDNTQAFESDVIQGVGTVQVPNTCYNIIEKISTFSCFNDNNPVWEFFPIISTNYVTGPVIYLYLYSPDAFKNNIITFEDVNFGPFTVLNITFMVDFNVSELPNYTIIINNQKLYVLDNVFSILNNFNLPPTLQYYINVNLETNSTYLEVIKPSVYVYTFTENSKGNYIQVTKSAQLGYYLYVTQDSKEYSYLFTIFPKLCIPNIFLTVKFEETTFNLYPPEEGQTAQSYLIGNKLESEVYYKQLLTSSSSSPSIYIYYWPQKNVFGDIINFYYIFTSEVIPTSQSSILYLTYGLSVVPYPTIQGCIDFSPGTNPIPTPFPEIPESACPNPSPNPT